MNRFPELKSPPGAPVLCAATMLPEGDKITVLDLSKAARTSHDTVVRDIKRGVLRADLNVGCRGYSIPRTAAVVYLVRKGIINPEAAYHDVCNLIADWPRWMKNQLKNLLETEQI